MLFRNTINKIITFSHMICTLNYTLCHEYLLALDILFNHQCKPVDLLHAGGQYYYPRVWISLCDYITYIIYNYISSADGAFSNNY